MRYGGQSAGMYGGFGAVISGSASLTGGTGVPVNVGQSGFAFLYPGSGSIGNNGALTLTTAYYRTITKGYAYFLADQIAAGVAAGWYYIEMSSTTAGTIYNNTYSTGNPTEPTTKTAFVTTGPGAYTGGTANITALSFPLAGGTMGKYGALHGPASFACTNSAGTKTFRVNLGGTSFMSLALTTFLSDQWMIDIRNAGVENQQIGGIAIAGAGNPYAASTTALPVGAIDTSAATTIDYQIQKTAAGDNAAWEPLWMTLLKPVPG